MEAIGVDRPALNAIIPAIGFFLSTLSLPYIEVVWAYFIHSKQGNGFIDEQTTGGGEDSRI